jgi:hypothetical protein
MELWGGKGSAINAVPFDATAFAHRDVHFTLQLMSVSTNLTYPEDGFAFMDGTNGAVSKILTNYRIFQD